MKRAAAEIVGDYGPFPGADEVHGVTFDGEHVWFASGDNSTPSIRLAEKPCAQSMSPPMPGPPSTAGISIRSARRASKRSILRAGAC